MLARLEQTGRKIGETGTGRKIDKTGNRETERLATLKEIDRQTDA